MDKEQAKERKAKEDELFLAIEHAISAFDNNSKYIVGYFTRT